MTKHSSLKRKSPLIVMTVNILRFSPYCTGKWIHRLCCISISNLLRILRWFVPLFWKNIFGNWRPMLKFFILRKSIMVCYYVNRNEVKIEEWFIFCMTFWMCLSYSGREDFEYAPYSDRWVDHSSFSITSSVISANEMFDWWTFNAIEWSQCLVSASSTIYKCFRYLSNEVWFDQIICFFFKAERFKWMLMDRWT